ncbi:MAG: SDR family oxidoreductase [Halobacteriovoraceae bacterium]|nr:SDR family oxidoreductase [Halobacteriovoraceae bacterium]
MSQFNLDKLLQEQNTWLVTGCAGFIGSHLIENLLLHGQKVIGVDNFLTGHRHNIEDVLQHTKQSENFEFVEHDLAVDCDLKALESFDVDYILHQAALGSVPRSIENPLNTHLCNVDAFIYMLEFAKRKNVKKFVYASSSSVYGDHPALPKQEENIGKTLSPYAATKRIDEVYADTFSKCYSLDCVGLRYFNVFGKRQDPHGAYAAVIPRWVSSLIHKDPIEIYGDGETSRDFCYVQNVVQANILAALKNNSQSNDIYNVACSERTTLNELKDIIIQLLKDKGIEVNSENIFYKDFRPGDVRHSLADISRAKKQIGYLPTHFIREGLSEAIEWYIANS